MGTKVSIVPNDPTGINQLLLDAIFREAHEYANTPTEYAVQEGSVISDHIRQTPEEITIESITTNTPSGVDTGIIATQVRPDQSNRAQLSYNTLIEWAGYAVNKQNDLLEQAQEPAILTVITGLKVFPSMVIKNLRIVRDKQTGTSAIRYVITLRKFKQAQAENFLSPNVASVRGNAPNIENKAQKQKNLGKQKPDAVENNSTLFNIVEDLIGDEKTKGAIPGEVIPPL